MHKLYLIFLLCSLVSIRWTSHAQTADVIIGNYFDRVSNGNSDNWSKIKSAYQELESSYSQTDFNKQIPNFAPKKLTTHKMFILWPDKAKDELYEDSTLVSTFYHYKRDHFFVMGNMPPMPIRPRENEPFYEFFPVTLKKILAGDPSVDLVGIRELDGNRYYHIRIKTSDLTWNLYFDMETYLLGYWNHSDMDSSTLTKLDNYRRVDEYLIPFSEIKTREGVVFYWSEIKKIHLNANFDEKIFQFKAK